MKKIRKLSKKIIYSVGLALALLTAGGVTSTLITPSAYAATAQVVTGQVAKTYAALVSNGGASGLYSSPSLTDFAGSATLYANQVVRVSAEASKGTETWALINSSDGNSYWVNKTALSLSTASDIAGATPVSFSTSFNSVTYDGLYKTVAPGTQYGGSANAFKNLPVQVNSVYRLLGIPGDPTIIYVRVQLPDGGSFWVESHALNLNFYAKGPSLDDSDPTAIPVNYQAIVKQNWNLKTQSRWNGPDAGGLANIDGGNYLGTVVTVSREINMGSTYCVLVTLSNGKSYWVDKAALSVSASKLNLYQLKTPLPEGYQPPAAYTSDPATSILQYGNTASGHLDGLAATLPSPDTNRRTIYYSISTDPVTQTYRADIQAAIDAWNAKFVNGPFVAYDSSKGTNVMTITVSDTYKVLGTEQIANMVTNGYTGLNQNWLTSDKQRTNNGTITLSKTGFESITASKSVADGNEARKDVVMHELGHSLGLNLDKLGPIPSTDPRYNDMMAVTVKLPDGTTVNDYSDDYAKDITSADLYFVQQMLNY